MWKDYHLYCISILYKYQISAGTSLDLVDCQFFAGCHGSVKKCQIFLRYRAKGSRCYLFFQHYHSLGIMAFTERASSQSRSDPLLRQHHLRGGDKMTADASRPGGYAARRLHAWEKAPGKLGHVFTSAERPSGGFTGERRGEGNTHRDRARLTLARQLQPDHRRLSPGAHIAAPLPSSHAWKDGEKTGSLASASPDRRSLRLHHGILVEKRESGSEEADESTVTLNGCCCRWRRDDAEEEQQKSRGS